MENIIKKSFKRSLKRKRRITEALIVCFLITGNTVFTETAKTYEESNSHNVIKDMVSNIELNPDEIIQGETGNGIIIRNEVSESNLVNRSEIIGSIILSDIEKYQTLPSNLFLEKNANGVIGEVYENDGIIKGNVTVIVDEISETNSGFDYEVNNSGNGVLGSVMSNNGIIKGEVEVQNSKSINEESYSHTRFYEAGNGILKGIANKNTGLISGSSKVTNTNEWVSSLSSDIARAGNGILGDFNIEDNLLEINSGVIKGEVSLDAFYVSQNFTTYAFSTGNGVVRTFIGRNNGLLQGSANFITDTSKYDSEMDNYYYVDTSLYDSGNGILEGQLTDNTGAILGYANNQNGYKMDNIFLAGTLNNSGNGVSYGNIGNNQGFIKGTATGTGGSTSVLRSGGASISGSGNGVYSNGGSGDQLTLNNLGSIIGEADNNVLVQSSDMLYMSTSLNESGNGIHSWDSNTKLINSGKITGKITDYSSHASGYSWNSGNGVSFMSPVEQNKGIISGIYNTKSTYISNGIDGSGNGLKFMSGQVVTNNSGLIQGHLTTINSVNDPNNWGSFLAIRESGNGLNNGSLSSNKGNIKGSIEVTLGVSEEGILNDIEIDKSGNGLALISGEVKNDLDNFGVISGSESSIAIENHNVMTKAINNYGILAGRQILGNGSEVIADVNSSSGVTSKELESIESEISDYNKYGISIILEKTEDNKRFISSITNGEGNLQNSQTLNSYTDNNGNNFFVLNTEIKTSGIDSYKIIDNNIEFNDYIINGAGIENGTLTSNGSEISLNNSIINGFETAVTLKEEGSLIAKNTIFNGGGLGTRNNNETSDDLTDDFFEYAPVIEGDSSENTASLSGESIINGDLNLGEGNDTLTMSGNSIANGDLILGSGDDTVEIKDTVTINKAIMLGMGDDELSVSTGVQLNDGLYGEAGKDTLNLGDTPYIQSPAKEAETTTINYDNSLNVYHVINGFEEINVEGSVTLYETAKIEGSETLHILKDSTLNLRIDPTEKQGDKVIGHALYNSGAVISGEALYKGDGHTGIENDTSAGTLNLVTNGLGSNSIIAMGNTKLDDKLYIRTDSLINKAERLDGDIQIKTGEDLASIFATPIDPATPIEPEPEVPEWIGENHYKKLDKVYKSIVNSGNNNINALYPTVNLNDKNQEAAGENLLLLLNDIFMANPYGYTAQASRETMGLFNEMVMNNPFKANKREWMVYGGLTYGDGDYDSSYRNYMSRNYYGFDTYNDDVSSNSKVYGGYALAEYGITDKTSTGLVFGGANSDTDISNGSKLDGDVLYVGAYGKTELNNFKFTAGAGYQYGDYETTRIAGNRYQRHEYENDIQSNGVTAYTEMAYDYALSSKWSLEPKVRVSYMRLKQDSVDEGNKTLAIETDSKSVTFWDTETGIDLVREITYANSKAHLKAGASYLYSLEGHEEDYVTGRMSGGSDFDILIPEQDRDRVKLKVSYDVEYGSGLIYDLSGGYMIGTEADQYYISIGLGYKFDSL